jgi:hypothetical protein
MIDNEFLYGVQNVLILGHDDKLHILKGECYAKWFMTQ